MKDRIVRIGGACSVDITMSVPQLVQGGNLDYILLDFLTETVIPLLAYDRQQDPGRGYAEAFPGPEFAAELRAILARGTKIVTNAGGLNPRACASAFAAMAAEMGLKPKIVVVEGDDVLDRVGELRAAGKTAQFTNRPFPENLASANVYLGAKPVADALATGADIVIAGRIVDAAMTLGPLIHEFGWSTEDYDRLAGGALVGHLLECGAHPTGGIFTDWRDVPDYANSSFPIAECKSDGSAIITKVAGTGGLVSVGTIAEQIVYEIGDPQLYHIPDVVCDLSQVKLEQVGPDRVSISGAKGYPPTSTYKVSCGYQDGWRASVSGIIAGMDATAKAERVSEALLERTRGLLRKSNLGEWQASLVELIGAERSYGAHARVQNPREVVYRIVIDHPTREGASKLLKVSGSAATSMAPGNAARPLGASVVPAMKVFSFMLDKDAVTPRLFVDGKTLPVAVPTAGGFDKTRLHKNLPLPKAEAEDGVAVPLVKLAFVRSGDKGNISNVGVIARTKEYLPYLNAALSAEAVGDWYRHLFDGVPRVDRYELPGFNAFNFLLHDALGGGGLASQRADLMGKAIAQQILEFPVPVPRELAASHRLND